MVVATYQLDVDLDNDGLWEAGENLTADIYNEAPHAPLVWERGKDQLRALAPPAAGKASWELNNRASAYGPTSNVKRGRPCRIRATHAAVTYDMFLGVLERPRQNPQEELRSVGVTALGTFSRLVGKETLSTALSQTITTDVAIGLILDAIGWPAGAGDGGRVLDVGKTTLDWWWLDGEDAWEAIKALLYSEGPGALIYEDGRGRFVFKNRHARITEARFTASQGSYGGAAGTGFYDAQEDDGLGHVINVCEIETKKRSAAALGVIWTLGSTVTLTPSETRKYIARHTSGDPMTAAVAPVDVTDYTVTVGSLSSVTLDRTSGATVTIILTAGTAGATVTGLQLRAQRVAVDSVTKVANTLDASASITEHSRQTFTLPVRAEIGVNVAQDFCNGIVSWYKDGRPLIRFTVPANADTAWMTQALAREVGDRIQITEANTGLSSTPF